MADNVVPAGGTALVYLWPNTLVEPDPGPLERDVVAEHLSRVLSAHSLSSKLLADT